MGVDKECRRSGPGPYDFINSKQKLDPSLYVLVID